MKLLKYLRTRGRARVNPSPTASSPEELCGGHTCTCTNLQTKVKTNNNDTCSRGKECFAPGDDCGDSDGGVETAAQKTARRDHLVDVWLFVWFHCQTNNGFVSENTGIFCAGAYLETKP